MDNFARTFFSFMTMAVVFMALGVFDKSRFEWWVLGFFVSLMCAMGTLFVTVLHEAWITPGYHGKWMRRVYNWWHSRA